MANGLTPLLPIESSRFDMITTYPALVRQNLKMLVLTVPGERMMDVNFGVGLKRYLFELNDNFTYQDIASRIREQVSRYMSFLEIQKIEFGDKENSPDLYPHDMRVSITYKIVPLQMTGTLHLDTNLD
tara:strand:- start:1020 stop:1403 length:384 start_codon:yes stop_codon:yes gene_type:complete